MPYQAALIFNIIYLIRRYLGVKTWLNYYNLCFPVNMLPGSIGSVTAYLP